MAMLSCLVYRRDEKTDLLILADDALQPLLSSPLCTRFKGNSFALSMIKSYVFRMDIKFK